MIFISFNSTIRLNSAFPLRYIVTNACADVPAVIYVLPGIVVMIDNIHLY